MAVRKRAVCRLFSARHGHESAGQNENDRSDRMQSGGHIYEMTHARSIGVTVIVPQMFLPGSTHACLGAALHSSVAFEPGDFRNRSM